MSETTDDGVEVGEDIRMNVERGLRVGSVIQFEGGGDPVRQIAEEVLPSPVIVAECSEAADSEDVIDQLLSELGEERPDVLPWSPVKDFLQEPDQTVLFTDFDKLDEEKKTVAQKIKGFSESCEAAVAVTAEDTGELSYANPDLRGRVRTVELD